MKRFILLIVLFLAALPSDAAGAKKITVMTSFLPVYCFVANVAGDAADVQNLLPAGVGPHDYHLSPRDVRKISKADLVFINGLELDDWLESALAKSSHKAPVIRISDGMEAQLLFGDPEMGSSKRTSGSHANPHIWLDPQLAIHAVSNIVIALQKADPTNAARYDANGRAYQERLQRLHQEFSERLASLTNSSFLTFHDAFPYLVSRYNLRLIAVVEQTAEVEPSPKYLSSLLRVAREANAKTLFTEPQFSSKLAKQIARDLKIGVAELDPMETGPLQADTYELIMRKNLRTLEKALK